MYRNGLGAAFGSMMTHEGIPLNTHWETTVHGYRSLRATHRTLQFWPISSTDSNYPIHYYATMLAHA